MSLGNALDNLPTNSLFQFPSGTWGFRGRVSLALCYTCKDGGEPSANWRAYGWMNAWLSTQPNLPAGAPCGLLAAARGCALINGSIPLSAARRPEGRPTKIKF
jgi:hypothetical protein